MELDKDEMYRIQQLSRSMGVTMFQYIKLLKLYEQAKKSKKVFKFEIREGEVVVWN